MLEKDDAKGGCHYHSEAGAGKIIVEAKGFVDGNCGSGKSV
jgi:hypothetical protein